jgi:ankyrin repeat protein
MQETFDFDAFTPQSPGYYCYHLIWCNPKYVLDLANISIPSRTRADRMLLDLPAELLWAIWAELRYKPPRCNALIKTCRLLYNTFNEDLYDYYIRRNQRDSRRHLIWAAVNGREICIGSFVSRGANPAIMDRASIGKTAGDHEPSFNFISHERDLVERRNWTASTPLCSAVRRGHLGVVKLLLGAGAEVNAHSKAGGLPIIWAVEAKQLEVLILLINSNATVDIKLNGQENLLGYAVSEGWGEGIGALLAAGKKGATYLYHQSTQAFENALRRAMLTANTNALVPFLNTMSNSNDRLCSGDTAFKIAVEEDFPGCIECVLNHGGLICHQNHGESWSALHRAVGNGNREATKVLLDNGASTESRDADGRAPLFLAVIEEDPEMVDLLLHQRANTEVRDSRGYTALLPVALRGSPGMIEHLLPKSDFNALDPRGHMPLSLAVQGEYISAMRALFEADRAAEQRRDRNRLRIDQPDSRGPPRCFWPSSTALLMLLSYYSASPPRALRWFRFFTYAIRHHSTEHMSHILDLLQCTKPARNGIQMC